MKAEPGNRVSSLKGTQRMTETDNKTRYGRIVVIFIALAIVIAAFVLFITMNNERISEQNTKYLQDSTEQSARRISEWMTDSQTEIKLLSSMYESTLSSVDEISADGIEQLANYTKFDYTTISLADGRTIDDRGQVADASDREYFVRGFEGESGVCAVDNSLFYDDLSVVFYTRCSSRATWSALSRAPTGKTPWRSSCAPTFSVSKPIPTCSRAMGM